MKCLFKRAEVVCSSQARLIKEVQNIVEQFRQNEYPEWLVARERDKFIKAERNTNKTSAEENPENEVNCVLIFPFIGNESIKLAKRVQKIFSDTFRINVRVAYRNFKVGNYFGLKDQTPDLFASNLVYQFRCSEVGDVSYIGTTTRHLWKRLDEHLNPRSNSAIQAHLAECDKCCQVPDLSQLVTVRKRCASPREAEIAESMLITEEIPTLNKRLGASHGRSFMLNVFK